jgi:hypothetical protein
MGNTSVLSTGAAIAVQFDNPIGQVYGGTVLSGKVFLSVHKRSISADTLNVKFFGQEYTHVTYTETVSDGDNNSRSETRTATQSAPIISMDYVLVTFGGSVRKGNYEYPFQITLPPGLPGKQGERIGSDYFLIEYFLEARLHRLGMLTWDVKNKTEIFLADPPYVNLPTPSFAIPQTVPVYFCCCINTGTMTLSSNVNNTNICMEEILRIDYSVHNESSSRVKALEIIVVEASSFHAMGHYSGSKNNLCYERIPAELLEGIETTTGNDTKNSTSTVLISTEAIKRSMKSKQFVFPTSRPTFRGQLGSVTHTVFVRIITPCCVQNPSIEIPLLVHRTAAPAYTMAPQVGVPFARPADWVAEAYPVVNLSTNVHIVQAMNAAATAEAGTGGIIPSAPSVPLDSVDGLISQLQQGNQWVESSILTEWLTYGDTLSLMNNPQTFQAIFRCIRNEYSYYSFPDILGKAFPEQITMQHIIAAASGVIPNEQGKVCINFSKYCCDKENAKQTLESLNLSSSTLSVVLLYY